MWRVDSSWSHAFSQLESDKPLCTLLKMWFYIFTFKIFTFERGENNCLHLKKGQWFGFPGRMFLVVTKKGDMCFSQNYERRHSRIMLSCLFKLIINELDTVRSSRSHVRKISVKIKDARPRDTKGKREKLTNFMFLYDIRSYIFSLFQLVQIT